MNTLHQPTMPNPRRTARAISKLLAAALLLALLLLPVSSALAGELQQTSTGIVKVKKFHDLNRDGIHQVSEPTLAGWTFDLYLLVNGAWVFQSSGVTPAGPLYFSDLQPGTYQVVEQPQAEWTNSTPVELTSDVAAGDLVALEFGNYLRDVDFGDLPDIYGMTTRAQDGARHEPGTIFLGAGVDIDTDGTPTFNANGDDLVGADEDGVMAVADPPNYWTQGQGTVRVTVTGGTGCLFAWMDVWSSATGAPGTDGDFGDSGPGWSEAIVTNLPLDDGTHLVNFALPTDAAKYPLWARFRLAPSNQGDCSGYDTNPVTTHGFMSGGEVEDYYFSFSPTAVSLVSFSARTDGADFNPALLAAAVLIAALLVAAGLLLAGRKLVRQPADR